jgi:hypothetical protein
MHWVRIVYLYLFALLGLVLLTVGGVQLVSLGLRTFVLTHADAELGMRHPGPDPPIRFQPTARDEQVARDTVVLSLEEREALRHWAAEYERYRRHWATVDPIRSRRQRDAARALALLLVGLPLYGYHWRVIRREREPPRPAARLA